MFYLHEELPESVIVDGIEYKVDMSFDNVIMMYEMLNDKDIDEVNSIILGIKMLFREVPNIPFKELKRVWEISFETLFSEEVIKPQLDIKGNPMPMKKEDKKKYMDLRQDAKYIYASFMSDYKIDLFEQQGKLHWYKFKALLDGLTESSRLSQVVKIRKMELPKGKGAAKQRKEIVDLKNHYKLKEEGEE